MEEKEQKNRSCREGTKNEHKKKENQIPENTER